MKLRLDKSSITIRIEPEERARLLKSGNLQERLSIDQNNFFDFAVELSGERDEIGTHFTQNCLTVLLPKKQAELWITSGQVGIRTNFINHLKNNILLVVEEDLPPRKKHTTS